MRYNSLKKGLEEVDAILSGDAVAPYEVAYDGPIRVEERENDVVTWKIADAIKTLKATDFSGIETPAAFFRIVREILGQSQNAMAYIYGVPKRTYERWEIDETVNTRASAKISLIHQMASDPVAFVRSARKPSTVGFMALT